MNTALAVIAIIFAALRIGGVKTKEFKDFAHLFTGGLFGAAAAKWSERWNFEAQWLLYLAVTLSLVELAVFLIDKYFRKGKQMVTWQLEGVVVRASSLQDDTPFDAQIQIQGKAWRGSLEVKQQLTKEKVEAPEFKIGDKVQIVVSSVEAD